MTQKPLYFDEVLDENLLPVFSGTPERTVEWLEENKWAHELVVCVGKTTEVLLVPVYLERKGVMNTKA